MSNVKSKATKHQFQSENKQILHLVTHALYSNKEVFVRELISNASDAADKLRYSALNQADLYGDDPDLKIWITVDNDAKTISIRDNGIGMDEQGVMNNLGTIAKSGTQEFIATLTGDEKKDSNLIGQFGVGFYSAFVVADKVTVRTLQAGLKPEQAIQWVSDGTEEYTIEQITKESRGTEIILHLKEDESEFLDNWRIKSLVTKYSDHIMLPIMLWEEKTLEPQPDEDKASEVKPEKQYEFEQINSATALWTMPKAKITDTQYEDLYKHISHDAQAPLNWTHNKVEGKLEYTSLLYIPKQAPFDLWNREYSRGLKLYVQRVFIMDDAEQLLPMYLRFVKGVVDSNDLPLNVSREILQSSRVVDSIKSACTKRVLSMLETMANNDKDKYQEFWVQFGQVIKEGVAEDFVNKDRIAKLLRFASTDKDTADQNVSLEDYVSRMKSEQKVIYYVTGDSLSAAQNSPHLEIFRKRGIEVLLLSDRIDEWLTANLQEFEGKKLQSVAKGEVDFGDKEKDDAVEKAQEVAKKDFESVIEQMKKVLTDSVKDVRLTTRLTDSPACLVTDDDEVGGHLKRLLEQAGQAVPDVKPTLELNAEHSLLLRLKSEQDDEQFSELSHVLFDQALLAEGGSLKEPAKFVKRLNKLLLKI